MLWRSRNIPKRRLAAPFEQGANRPPCHGASSSRECSVGGHVLARNRRPDASLLMGLARTQLAGASVWREPSASSRTHGQ